MWKAFGILLFVCYVAVVIPLTRHLDRRTVAVKLGYTPDAQVLKLAGGEYSQTLSEFSVLKVLFYFGSVVEKWQHRILIRPEFYNMFKTIETAIRLDPYNKDAYYFAEASFTWEVGHAADVNRLLAYGMKYRTWDPDLPFYAGFNAFYFLHDKKAGADYMEKAAEISGNSLYTTLAARLLYESGRTEMGVRFLDMMEKRAKTENERRLYAMRKAALIAVLELKSAVEKYEMTHRQPPADLQMLVKSGILKQLPPDPYGGRFYLGPKGAIRSTSDFALGKMNDKKLPPEQGLQ